MIPFSPITATMSDRFQIYDGKSIPQPVLLSRLSLDCGGVTTNADHCNPAIDREMQRAELLEPTHPARSSACGKPSSHLVCEESPDRFVFVVAQAV